MPDEERKAAMAKIAFAFLGALSAASLASAGPLPAEGPAPSVTAEWKGDLDGMSERRMIRALVPYSKTLYFVDRGAQRGLSYEYMQEFEAVLNKERKSGNLRVNVVFVPTTRDQMLPMLDAGRGDIAVVDATVSAERLELVDFTTPIVRDVKEIVVTGPASPAIATLDDLAGKTVFVRPDSTREAHLRELSAALVAKGKPAIDVQLTPQELEPEDLLEMTNAGLLPAVVVNGYYGRFWKQVFPELDVREDLVVSDGNDIAFAMRKGSPRLKAALDSFLATRSKGSAFGNVLANKYFKNTQWVKSAANEAEMAKFRALVDYFKKYSTEYDVDWMLMAAQGYQESRLDQSVRSPVGAIGVMQVMPATGKDMNVGDITIQENNIRAGIKYVRFVMDNFFANEPMDRKNKMLFAFASYNAGPGRVAGLRKEAAKRGLDANVWFNNVEQIASEKIGRETVQYVSNIYKYYIAYTLAQQQVEKLRAARDATKT